MDQVSENIISPELEESALWNGGEYGEEEKQKATRFLIRAAALPGIRVDRLKFLQKLLKDQYPAETWTAIRSTPAEAGIPPEALDRLADRVIREETASLTAISAVSGIPKGWLILMSLPADIAQYYAHMLRLIQKLDYIYGSGEYRFENGRATEETARRLLKLTGIMYGAADARETAANIGSSVSAKLQSKTNGKLRERLLATKPVQSISQKIPAIKTVTGKSPILPFGKMLASGVVSFAAFRDMARRLKKYLSGAPLD